MNSPSGHYEVHLRDYLYVLRKRRFVILFFFLAVLAAGIAFTAFEKVIFKRNFKKRSELKSNFIAVGGYRRNLRNSCVNLKSPNDLKITKGFL